MQKTVFPLVWLSLLVYAWAQPLAAQPRYTLDECIRLARQHYPQTAERNTIRQGEQNDLQANRLAWAPQLSVNAKTTYQSEVTQMPFSIPGYDFDLPNCQYGLTADLSQQIWDGGSTHNRHQQIQASAEVRRRQLDVSLYGLNDRVETLYMGILLADKQLIQNGILAKSLERKQAEAEARLASGMAYRSDIDVVRVNRLDCLRQRQELEHDREARIRMLGDLIGCDLHEAQFEEPAADYGILADRPAITRPELLWYEAQQQQHEASRRELQTRLSPRLSLTLQGGIGRPGLNMLSKEADPYYMAGLKLQWDLGALYTRKNDLRKIRLQQQGTDIERQTFLLNTRLDITQQQQEIRKIQDALEQDSALIVLRERIRTSGEEQYTEGVLKMTELMTLMDDEHNARLTQALHQIQLLAALRKLQNILGTTND